MANNWQAPTTHNEGDRSSIVQGAARPYLDAVTGRVKWWIGLDPLPVGAVPYFIAMRAGDGRRVISDDSTDEREPRAFGSRLLFW